MSVNHGRWFVSPGLETERERKREREKERKRERERERVVSVTVMNRRAEQGWKG